MPSEETPRAARDALVKITMTIRKDVWRQFRIACIEQDVSASKVAEGMLLAHVTEWQAKQQGHIPTQKGEEA